MLSTQLVVRRAGLLSVAAEATIIIVLIALFIFPANQPSYPGTQTSFRLEYTKTGGIAGLHENLVIEADGSANFTSRQLSFRSTVPLVEFSELGDTISRNVDRISPNVIQPRPGSADYFGYSLLVIVGGKSTQIEWVDDWAAATKVPDELKTVQRSVERVLQVLTVQATFTNRNSAHAYVPGFTITIFADKATYKLGEQVRIFVIIENTGPVNATYVSPTPCHPDIRILVSGASRTQDISFSDLPVLACIDVLQQRSLEPNRFLAHSATWNLLFDQDDPRIDASPGVYTISARFPYASFEQALLQVSVTISISS